MAVNNVYQRGSTSFHLNSNTEQYVKSKRRGTNKMAFMMDPKLLCLVFEESMALRQYDSVDESIPTIRIEAHDTITNMTMQHDCSDHCLFNKFL